MSYHHKPIRKFDLEGSIYDDAHIERLKHEYIALVVLGMKEEGYVPRYEIDVDFTLEYVGYGYRFKVSVYGSFVGKRKAQEIDGLDGYRPRYAPGVKSNQGDKKTV